MAEQDLERFWQPPAPRAGLAGAWDRFIGAGATRVELWLQIGAALLAGAAAATYAL